jgi:PIN domain nuclease of toxin-antitoxin system
LTVVLDACAVIELLAGSSAGERVRAAVAEEGAAMSSINLGEVQYVLMRSRGDEVADRLVDGVSEAVRVDTPDLPLVRSAARIKAGGHLSYAEAFCLATAARYGGAVLTGDPEIVAAAGDVDVIDLGG